MKLDESRQVRIEALDESNYHELNYHELKQARIEAGRIEARTN